MMPPIPDCQPPRSAPLRPLLKPVPGYSPHKACLRGPSARPLCNDKSATSQRPETPALPRQPPRIPISTCSLGPILCCRTFTGAEPHSVTEMTPQVLRLGSHTARPLRFPWLAGPRLREAPRLRASAALRSILPCQHESPAFSAYPPFDLSPSQCCSSRLLRTARVSP